MKQDRVWRLLFIDDDPEQCSGAVKSLDGQMIGNQSEKICVESENDFVKALIKLETGQYDFVVLDVRLGSILGEPEEEEGIKTLEAIRAKCFIPVIFYTALPNKVAHLRTPLIRVIEKTQGFNMILASIKEIYATKLPQVRVALYDHVQEIQRNYMWTFVSENWDNLGEKNDKSELAYLLARRLAKSLDGPGIENLINNLGGLAKSCSEENVHPMRYYIIPPMGKDPTTGDIFRYTADGSHKYIVLLTPACDLDHDNVEYMVFAHCPVLALQPEYLAFVKDTNSNAAQKKLEKLVKDNREDGQRERYKFLPGAVNLPDLIADFQMIFHVKFEEFSELSKLVGLERIASLDSPYAETLVSRFTRYFNRVGVPDLHVETVIEKITEQIRTKAKET